MSIQQPEKSKFPAKSAPRWFAAIIFWLGWISAGGAFLCLALFITTGERITLVRWASYLAPWLAGWLVILTIPAILARKAFMVISLLILAMPPTLISLNLFSSSKIDQAAGRSYKVMTYSKMGRNNDVDSVARVILSEKPDILFVQEISEPEAVNLIQLLNGIYDGAPLYYLADAHYGLILSRYQVTPHLKAGDYSQAAEIELPEQPLRVWNVHLQKSIANTDTQYRMTDQLAEQIALTNGAVIAAGDFNATVLNYPYRKIRQQLENAFENAGSGFGFTFPSPARRSGIFTPFMRIDHIFYSRQFNIHKSYVVQDSGNSDHYPVVATLSLKKAKG
jgi:endonuclease/exonuclease/phosphatase family metal-dependent hydrolase